MISVSINGDKREFSSAMSLEKLLEELGYKEGFAVAINTTFVPISKYSSTIINDGDEIDILSAIQGG